MDPTPAWPLLSAATGGASTGGASTDGGIDGSDGVSGRAPAEARADDEVALFSARPLVAPTPVPRHPSADLAASAVAAGGVHADDDLVAWFHERMAALAGTVTPAPLEALDRWHFTTGPVRLVHESGKFFAIDGCEVTLGFGGTERRHHQPVINQREVGILGFLTTVLDGARHVLVQAKMEPGNVHRVQLAPTVQATESNFTRVHAGTATRYLEHFVRPPAARVLVDERQPEQGRYFLRKRNRNVVVDVDPDLPVADGYRWVTLRQLAVLLQIPYALNMDSRSVLSCLPVAADPAVLELDGLTPFAQSLARSALLAESPVTSRAAAESWWEHQGHAHRRTIREVSLDGLDGWQRRDGALVAVGDGQESGPDFSVVGVRVSGGEREVDAWDQPLVARRGVGLLGLLVQEREGVLHALVEATNEVGCVHAVQVSPTVVSHADWTTVGRHRDGELRRWFEPGVREGLGAVVRYDVEQSEEGGRFYELAYRYSVVQAPTGAAVPTPPGAIWLTFGQLAAFRARQRLSVELRNLLACVRLTDLSPPPEPQPHWVRKGWDATLLRTQ